LLDDEDSSYERSLATALRDYPCTRLEHFEIEDRPMEERIIRFAASTGIGRRELPSPMFLCSRAAFGQFASGGRRLLMADFYRWQREGLGILIDESGAPAGGRWSFDAENRRKLPARMQTPALPSADNSTHVRALRPHPHCQRGRLHPPGDRMARVRHAAGGRQLLQPPAATRQQLV
jgi:deoxyribodipyrimidine photolyase-related protein